MVEIPSSQNYVWNANVTTYRMRSFDYRQEYNDGNSQTLTVNKNVAKNVLQKNSQPIMKEPSTQPCAFLPGLKHTNIFEDQRLNNIFRMCLESSFGGLGERLSLTSPKNFVVQYFTVSQNQPVKVGCGSQFPSAGQSLRKQESELQPVCPELTRCKHNRIISLQCSKPPNEIHDDLAESTPYVISTKKAGDSHKDEGRPRSCAGELLNPRKDTLQQTDPELSWQEKCSNFIINLPETLSDKFFGPRITCDESNICKRNVVSDNPKLNTTQPVPKNFSRLGSTDQGNEKSVKSQANTPANHECHTSTSTKRVCLEKMRKVDPCHSRTFHFLNQEDVVPCRRSGLETENCEVTRRKMKTKCCKSFQDRFSPLENSANRIQSKESEPREPQFKFGAKNSTRSSFLDHNERGKASSNWPAILSGKIFGPRHEGVLQPCMVDDEVTDAKARKGDVDSPEIVNLASLPLAEKKGRLLVKKYTISQTPDAMEETLCFKILGKEQLPETRTKLQSKVCVKFTNDNQQKLDTAQKWNASKTGKSHTLKRCVKSKANYSRSGSRQIQQLEKKTSTEHIFLSSLIMKLLNGRTINKDTKINKGKKCYRDRAIRRSTISRRYATTSIHKDGHKPIRCSRHVLEEKRKNGVVPCSLEQKISLDCCTDSEFPNVAGKDKIRGEIAKNYLCGRKEVSAEVSSGTCNSEENLANLTDLSEKVTHTMRHDCSDRSADTSSELQEKYQNIYDTCGTSKAIKDLVNSGVSQVIDESCRRGARVFHTSHEKKRDAKLTVREKYCKEIPSPNKSASRVRKRDRIENYDSRLECRGCFDSNLSAQRKGTTETEICVLTHRDKSVAEKEFKDCEDVGESEIPTPGNCNVIIARREEEPRKQFPIEKLTVERCCERLIIKEDGIFYSSKHRGLLYFGESPRPTVVVAGENIRVKMFYDRETLTDDLPEFAYCHESEFLKKAEPSQKTPRAQCSPAKNKEKIKTLPPPSHKSGRMGIIKVPQTSFPVESLSSSVQRVCPEQIGNSNMQKQLENCVEIRVGSEECVGLLREDNTSRASPGGIPKDDYASGTEPGMGEVFSPLCQEASEKRENKVFGGEACPDSASIDSESKEALPQSHSKDNNFPSSLVAATISSAEGQSKSEKEGAVDYRQPLNDYPEKSERLDGVKPNIDSPEKMESREKSSGKDFGVAKPESRNIINSYYSLRKNVAFSRCESRNDEHSKVKKEKEQRDGSGADKSITHGRKPLRRIENVRQVGRTAKVEIRNDTGKKRNAEKENDVTNQMAPPSPEAGFSNNEAMVYSVRNVTIDSSTFPNAFNADSQTSPAPIQKLENRVSRASRSTASKIPRKSGPLSKSKSPIRVSYSAEKALESQNAKIKESFRRNWLENGNSKTACSETDAKETNGEAGKIAEGESSNRVTGLIDTRKAKGNETQKELQAPAVYVIDEENVKVRTSQIETPSTGKQNIQNDSIVKGTGETANRRGNSKSSKSPSRQKDDELQDEDGRSHIAGGEQKRKKNMQAMESISDNQSKSETASKKNERHKKSTPLEILSQNDSAEMDADSSMQGRVTTKVNLFDATLMDGADNIQSYSDLLSADEENYNAYRIRTTKDERLQKSRTATVRGKPKLFRSSKGQRTGNASAKMNNARKSLKPEDRSSKTTESFNTADTARGKEDTKTSLANAHNQNSGKGLKADAKFDRAAGTREFSISVNSAEMGHFITCENDGNGKKNVALASTVEWDSKKIEHLQVTSKNDLKQNSITLTDCHSDKSCTTQRAENHGPSRNIATGQSSVRIYERLSSEFGAPTHRTKGGTSMLSSRVNSDFNEKRNQGSVCRYIFMPGQRHPPGKSRGHKDALESSCGSNSTKNAENFKQQKNDCSKEEEYTDNDSAEVISDIGDYQVRELNCKKSVDPRCAGTVSRVLFKGVSNIEKEIVRNEYCDTGKSNAGPTRENCSFADDLKRLLDQGKDFFTLKKKSKCADCQKLNNKERDSNSSISSIQKAYNALKTILNKSKNIHIGLMYIKQTKGTQIYPRTLDESSVSVEDCVKSHRNEKYLGSKISDDDQSLIPSISFESSIFSNSSSPARKERDKKL